GVELVEHDVDVVRPDAGGQCGDAPVIEPARVGHELAVPALVVHPFESRADPLHAAGVAHHQHDVAQLLGAQGQVVHRTIGVQDQFAWGDLGAGGSEGDGTHGRYVVTNGTGRGDDANVGNNGSAGPSGDPLHHAQPVRILVGAGVE